MGCGSSKRKVCQNCQEPYSPARRSYSYQPRKSEDTRHPTAKIQSVQDSVRLDPSIQNRVSKDEKNLDHCVIKDKTFVENRGFDKVKMAAKEEFEMWIDAAKSWSKMIDKKISKIVPETPVRRLNGEAETKYVRDLIEGLQDIGLFRRVRGFRSVSLRIPRNQCLISIDDDDQLIVRVKEERKSSPKPLWMHFGDSSCNSNATSKPYDFDLEDFLSTDQVRPRPTCDHNPTKENALDVEKKANTNVASAVDKLIVYFTSLRGVRRTFEDCCEVRSLLKGLGVKVDERDLSMDLGFKDELRELMGKEFSRGGLPRVFVGHKYIGGVEEIRQLNEEGELEKIVKSCERIDFQGGDIGGRTSGVCEVCGDARFVPCEKCSGSCKIYYDEKELDEGEGGCGFYRCPYCNENGLVRCRICCD